MIQQVGMIQLPQRLVDRDGYGIAQIQAPCFLTHGDPDTIFKVGIQKILRKTFGLLTEEQVTAVGKFRVRIAPGSLGGKAPKFLDIILGKEVIQIIIDPDIHKMPIVQSCPADSLFGNVKPQGADQMQHCAGGGTSAGNVAAVLGNLRFMQYDVEQNVSPRKPEHGLFPDARHPIVLQKTCKINPKNRFFSTFTV